ncbi:MAG: ATP synthase F1 subunit gamma [Ignavibacteria bacterium]|jgi:F-type H+-transporting ATPase subunit gamma|nr:ATP synthase F1 subunit gamma [Ignavibacteria bacterium]
MATLRDIRNRIAGVTSIQKITSAMKMVSSIKSRRAQKQAESARPFNRKINEILSVLISSRDEQLLEHPLLQPSKDAVRNVAIIVIAGDKGMCGSFNNNLLKFVDAYLHTEFKEQYPDAIPHLILIGTKPVDYYKKRSHDILKTFPNAFQTIDYAMIEDIHDLVVKDFINGKIDRVSVFFNKFINIMKQVPTNQPLLPVTLDPSLMEANTGNIDYIFEPNKQEILNTLLNQYIDLNIWVPVLESNAAEQAARLIAMDMATKNAKDLIGELELQYNNARQAAITTEMLEIVGGSESLRK